MTLPAEEVSSLKRAREFLRSLIWPKETPRVPKAIREEACRLLRHYPADYIIDEVYKERLNND